MNSPKSQLTEEYRLRFSKLEVYRRKVWKMLIKHYLQNIVGFDKCVLDVGCGWGEFINEISAKEKYAIDLNPDAEEHLSHEVIFANQSCAQRWPIGDSSLDIIFTSNFLEHLPSKDDLIKTILEASRCLKTGGKIICLGPNIKYTGGSYWDFFDHHIPLTEASISEILEMSDFHVEVCLPKFLPYTMSSGKQVPLWFIVIYLRFPLIWKLLGRQFLVIAQKP